MTLHDVILQLQHCSVGLCLLLNVHPTKAFHPFHATLLPVP